MRQEIKDIFNLICEMGAPAYESNDNVEREKVPVEYINRTASAIGEYLTENDLKEMIDLVDPTGSGNLTLENFMKTMNKTSIW